MKKYILITIALITIATIKSYAQVAINTTGAAADSSAMLDIASTSQGMLVPRMDSAQRVTISHPATGLLVYQTNGSPGFYYYNSTAWTYLPSIHLTGAITSVGNATSYNSVVPANKGGAGTINGILKANGTGTVVAASGTDFPGTITNVRLGNFSSNFLSTTDGVVYSSTNGIDFILPTAASAGKGKVIYIRGDPTNIFTVSGNNSDQINQASDGTLTSTTNTRSYGMYVSNGVSTWIEITYR